MNAESLHTPEAIASMQEQAVKVLVMDFAELCTEGAALQLDHYQRPYVWDSLKVNQLLDDLHEFKKSNTEHVYYLGTVLLHRHDEKQARFVIDGQQRLSTLAVLHHALRGSLPQGIAFHYRSPISARNLRETRRLIAERDPAKLDPSIFDQLRFTVITVEREDLAFTFFDTQNHRGVPLNATDLLKAYHLRAVSGTDKTDIEALQKICAERWESVQAAGPQRQVNQQQDFAPVLFNHFLWRARNWRGSKCIEREDHDRLLDTFQHESISGHHSDEIPLYPGHRNQFASSLKLQGCDDYQLALSPVQVGGSSASLPFTLRQPIHKGVGFFLYAQKYAALLDALLYQASNTQELLKFRDFYRRVVCVNSSYLQELFKLALLMYVDRFGYQQLSTVAVGLELVLGGLRLDKSYIFQTSPLKYLKDAPYNLLDEISGAYRPEEVKAFLRSEIARSDGYKKAAGITQGKGVQGRYLDALLEYLGKEPAADSNNWVLACWSGE